MKLLSVESHSDATLWDAYVDDSQVATGYHRIGWKSVYFQSYGLKCHYLAAVDAGGHFHGVLPLIQISSRIFGNELVSLPFVNYGGILFDDGIAKMLLLEGAVDLGRQCGAARVELRHSSRCLDDLPTKRHKVSMILDLFPDESSQWKSFDSKLRNQVRKAEKSNLRAVVGHNELLDGFYEVLAYNMRDLGSPVHAKHFFRNVLETFPDSSRIVAIYLEDRMIAAGLLCWFKGTMEIPWASSIRIFNSLCPNNLMYWRAIQFAISCGMTRFDFGRSTPHEGTYKFKAQWGAQPAQLNWQYLLDSDGTSQIATQDGKITQIAIAIWKKLPVSLTKMIGPMVRKNVSL